jgi:integrase
MCLRYHKKKVIFSTGILIDPKKFVTDKSKRLYMRASPSLIGYTELNLLLDNMESTANTIYLRFQNEHKRYPNTDEFRKLLAIELRGEKEKEKPTLTDFVKTLIDDAEKNKLNSQSGKVLSKGYIRIFKSTLKKLKQYEVYTNSKVDFENIDLAFYNSWVQFLTQENNLAWNTTGRFIKSLKTIMGAAVDAGFTTNMHFRNKNFKVLTEKTESIFLTNDEINQIFELKLESDKRLERVRDTFVIQCRTGLRFSDVSKLRKENIEGNMLRVKSTKTNKSVIIPIHFQVQKIIDRYKDSYSPFPKVISSVKFNKYLKEVAQKIPSLNERIQVNITKGGRVVSNSVSKWEMVSSHVGRRSFCTGLYLENISSSIIMSLSGHSSEAQFRKYLKADNFQNANIVLKHWENNNNVEQFAEK